MYFVRCSVDQHLFLPMKCISIRCRMSNVEGMEDLFGLMLGLKANLPKQASPLPHRERFCFSQTKRLFGSLLSIGRPPRVYLIVLTRIQ